MNILPVEEVLYAGSFDPFTNGHLDVANRLLATYPRLRIAAGIRQGKEYTFSLEERTGIIRHEFQDNPRVEVTSFNHLLVDYAKEQLIPIIYKGVRDGKDMQDEENQATLNRCLQKEGVETFFVVADASKRHISSSGVKEVLRNEGLIHEMVSLHVKEMLEERISHRYMVGVTGEIGSGKSTITKMLLDSAKRYGIPAHEIDLDEVWHEIIGHAPEPMYVKVREDIAAEFGSHLVMPDGSINRRGLGPVIFSDPRMLDALNRLAYDPLLMRVKRNYLPGKEGIVFFNAALIVESNLGFICNNDVIFIQTNKDKQREGLQTRPDYPEEKIETRLQSQYTTDLKLRLHERRKRQARHGKTRLFDNSRWASQEEVDDFFLDFVKDRKIPMHPA